MKRRTFIQSIVAAAAFVISPLRIFSRAKAPIAESVPVVPRPASNCIYVYNPGLDIEGVEAHTFGRHKVIYGGCVTKITVGEEAQQEKPQISSGALLRGHRFSGPHETKNYFGMVTDRRYIISHPPQVILDSINYTGGPLSRTLVHIPEWDDRTDIDLSYVNRCIAGDTLTARERMASKARVWSGRPYLFSAVLLKWIRPAIKEMRITTSRLMDQIYEKVETGQIRGVDRFGFSIACLAELPPPDTRKVRGESAVQIREHYASRYESNSPSSPFLQIRHSERVTVQEGEREFEAAKRRIRERARAILSKENT